MKPAWQDNNGVIYHGDCLDVLKQLTDESIDCCITSPPYWGLRDYGAEGQLGLEKTPEEYVAKMISLFSEVKRVLKKEGTLWLNLGDSYSGSGKGGGTGALSCKQVTNKGSLGLRDYGGNIPEGLKPKDLVGIPWRVAFALQADGWYLRQDIIWAKPNPMPESVTDRCTKSHEYIFLLSKSQNYYFDNEAIAEPAQNWGTRDRSQMRGGTIDPHLKHHGLEGSDEENQTRNKRSVWTVTTKPFSEAHFATFPPDLITPMVKAGCSTGGTILDPFMGSGTTALVAKDFGRRYVGIELNKEYIDIASRRLSQEVLF